METTAVRVATRSIPAPDATALVNKSVRLLNRSNKRSKVGFIGLDIERTLGNSGGRGESPEQFGLRQSSPSWKKNLQKNLIAEGISPAKAKVLVKLAAS